MCVGFRRLTVFLFLVVVSSSLYSQVIKSDYVDLTVPGQWEQANNYNNGITGVELYYDAKTGSLVQIRALASMQKVSEISKYFQSAGSAGPSADPSQALSLAVFPLPDSYTERAAKDVAKGIKPPRMWEMKEGEGNPTWFYTSQLFGQYNIKAIHGGSEVEEEYIPVRVLKAEHKGLPGGEALVFELETDRAASEAAIKRFHMPSTMKDQRIRFSWIQYSPGGVASGQGVLSVVAASPANSDLTSDSLLTQISSAKLKPMD